MNIASAELLQQAWKNLGDTTSRNRAQDAEDAWRKSTLDEAAARRLSEDQYRRDQVARQTTRDEKYDEYRGDHLQFQQDQFAAAQKGTVSADLTDPSTGAEMHFNGPKGTLDQMLVAAEKMGKPITVGNRQDFSAQFNLGHGTFAFKDQARADNFVKGWAEKGVDLYADKPKGVTGTQVVINSRERTQLQDELAAATASGDKAAEATAKRKLENFDMMLPGANKAAEPSYDVVRETRKGSEGSPGIPEVKGFFGGVKTPARPAVPAQPDTTIERRVPRGWNPGDPIAAAPAAPPVVAGPAARVAVQPHSDDVRWLIEAAAPTAAKVAAFEKKYGAGSAAAAMQSVKQAATAVERNAWPEQE